MYVTHTIQLLFSHCTNSFTLAKLSNSVENTNYHRVFEIQVSFQRTI